MTSPTKVTGACITVVFACERSVRQAPDNFDTLRLVHNLGPPAKACEVEVACCETLRGGGTWGPAPLSNRFAQGFGRSIFETAMRLDPGWHRADGGAAVVGVRETGLAQRGGDLARAAVGGVIPNDPPPPPPHTPRVRFVWRIANEIMLQEHENGIWSLDSPCAAGRASPVDEGREVIIVPPFLFCMKNRQ